jgi:hypothetical protein
MRKLNIFLLVVFLGSLVMMLSSCECFSACNWWGKKKGNGPPAHAKAYGLRGKGQGAVNVNVNVSPGSGTAGQIENVRQEANTVIVNITNSNGSITPVTLKRSGNFWIGPRGEQYMSVPTAEQLKPIYGM